MTVYEHMHNIIYIRQGESILSAANREKILINEVAAHKLLKLIEEKQLKSGDKLPTERDLCTQLGVSRTSLREALNSLKSNGIVSIRQGSGIYVATVDQSMISHYQTLAQRDSKDILTILHDILGARMMIEPYCAREVAKIITEEQIAILLEHEMDEYQRLLVAAQKKNRDFVGMNLEQLIVSFLENPVISNIHSRLNVSWKTYQEEIDAVFLSANHRHKNHMAIINALEERNPTRAERAVFLHLEESKESVRLLIDQHK